jgi:hypothetical protein
MTERVLKIPKPNGPHDDTLSDPSSSIQGICAAGRVLVTYCKRNHCGAICYLEVEPHPMWRMFAPIPIGELIRGCATSGITLPDGEDLQRWLTAVCPVNEQPN